MHVDAGVSNSIHKVRWENATTGGGILSPGEEEVGAECFIALLIVRGRAITW